MSDPRSNFKPVRLSDRGCITCVEDHGWHQLNKPYDGISCRILFNALVDGEMPAEWSIDPEPACSAWEGPCDCGAAA